MKKNMQILLVIIGLFICSVSVDAKPPVMVKMAKGEARVTALEGKVQAFCTGQKYSRYLKIKDVLQPGCEISTGDNSHLELILPDSSIVRFAENTRFQLLQVEVNEAGLRDVKISVTIGKIWSNVRKALTGRSGFEVSCENAVAGVRGTVYRMDVEGDKSALVKVYDGEVSVAGVKKTDQSVAPVAGPPKPVSGPIAVAGPKQVSMDEWVYIVKSMQQIRIKSNGQAEEPKEFAEAEDVDDWVKWNKKRDSEK